MGGGCIGFLPHEAWLHDEASYNRRSKLCVTYSTCKKYIVLKVLMNKGQRISLFVENFSYNTYLKGDGKLSIVEKFLPPLYEILHIA